MFAPNVFPTLDTHSGEVDDEGLADRDADCGDDDQSPSIMRDYLAAIQHQLKKEFSERSVGAEPRWLRSFLKQWEHSGKGWRIRQCESKFVCEKLGIPFTEYAYYKDVVVWLPDERWGDRLPCPTCNSSDRVGPHCWHQNHIGRRVIGLENCYFVLSRRYICLDCRDTHHDRVRAASAVLNQEPILIDDTTEDAPYTFMGYDRAVLTQLPHGRGDEFPAFFMHRSGVDKRIISLMRPLFNYGVRPDSFAKMLLELHTLEHATWHLFREHLLAFQRKSVARTAHSIPDDLFSDFGDRTRYDGASPTGRYLARVYLEYFKTIEEFLANDVKKRGAEVLAWDASYKEAKHLATYHGEKVFLALITATNEYGEIRVQFHVVTDGHDQMDGPIAALKDTMAKFGQNLPTRLFTDKPAQDKRYFLHQFPSLHAAQKQLDDNAFTPAAAGPSMFNVNFSCIAVKRGAKDINSATQSLASTLASMPDFDRTIGLDCEWDTTLGRHGEVRGSGSVAVIQLAYYENDELKVLILHVHGLRRLPTGLIAMFTNPRFTFVGRGVKGDISRVSRNFKIAVPSPRLVPLMWPPLHADAGWSKQPTCLLHCW